MSGEPSDSKRGAEDEPNPGDAGGPVAPRWPSAHDPTEDPTSPDLEALSIRFDERGDRTEVAGRSLDESRTSARRRSVRSVDLFASQRRVDRSFPGLGIVLDRTATGLADELGRRFRTTVEVYASPPETLKLDEYRQDLPQPSVAVQLALDGLGCRGMFSIEFALVLRILELRFGGGKLPERGGRVPTMRARFSAVEEQICLTIVSLFCHCMERGWAGLLETRVRPGPLEYKLSSIRVAGDADEVVSCAFEVVIGRIQGTLQCALPLESLELHKETLDESIRGGVRDGSASWQGSLARNLLEVPVPMVAELGRVSSSFEQLVALRPGDVIRLQQPADEPVCVSLGGGVLLYGMPCTRHGNLAIKVRTLPSGTSKGPEKKDE
jgi:flagellar motor switch protein FliM